MSRIIITTDDQNLSFTNMPDIYSGDVNYDEVEFVFDETWNSMSRTAVFYIKDTIENPVGVLLDSDNVAKIPYELISNDIKLYIGVYGLIEDNIVKTSQVLVYNIGKGCPINTHEPEGIADSYWQQVLSVLGVTQQDIVDTNVRIDGLISNTNSKFDETNAVLSSHIQNNENEITQINSDIGVLRNDIIEIQNKLNTIEISTLDEVNVFLGIGQNTDDTQDTTDNSGSTTDPSESIPGSDNANTGEGNISDENGATDSGAVRDSNVIDESNTTSGEESTETNTSETESGETI